MRTPTPLGVNGNPILRDVLRNQHAASTPVARAQHAVDQREHAQAILHKDGTWTRQGHAPAVLARVDAFRLLPGLGEPPRGNLRGRGRGGRTRTPPSPALPHTFRQALAPELRARRPRARLDEHCSEYYHISAGCGKRAPSITS